MFIILSLPSVQTNLAERLSQYLEEEFNTNIVVDKVDLSLLGEVNLKDIEIRDHHKDTLIFVKSLKTSILNAKKIVDNKLNLGEATVNGGFFYMKKYKGEQDDNLSVFVHKFDSEEPKDSANPFILNASQINLKDVNYVLIDESKEEKIQFAAYKINGVAKDFFVNGSNVGARVSALNFTDDRNINIKDFNTDFSYTPIQMNFFNTDFKTDHQSHVIGNVVMRYTSDDLKDFTDKVKIKGEFSKSAIAVKDLSKLYGEIGGSDLLYFKGKVTGVLNDFNLDDFYLTSKRGMRLSGSFSFTNAFNADRGFVFNSDIDNFSSSSKELKKLLPNILGPSLPPQLDALGDFNLLGDVKVTSDKINANVELYSEIGITNADITMNDFSDNQKAGYTGAIEFVGFDLGAMTKNPDLGKVSLNADVSGKGFKIDHINTSFLGTITSLNYKGYNYKNLEVNGEFQNEKFEGFLDAKDENVKLNFKGLADFSSEVNKFDFTTDIKTVDLKKLKLFTRDSISELKGRIKLDITGNTLDNMVGVAKFSNLTYKSPSQKYIFKEFEVNSSLIDSVKTIKVDSKDIVNGHLEGKFTFNELLPVFQNALGSVYTNYEPIPVAPNQFVNFDFTIHNEIVNLFFPDVSISKNTKIKGKINANKNSVKLNFASEKLDVYENSFEDVKMRLDNLNKLYNTHLTADKIKNKYYEINKLNLLNRTVNDTLFFKTAFKGGKKQKEEFNLNFFYTIDSVQKSVIGLQKSAFNHNGFDWIINPEENKSNKMSYLVKEKSFDFSPFTITSADQKIEFSGTLKGDHFKDLNSKFTNFEMTSILPEMETLQLSGTVNGTISLKENYGNLQPRANLKISNILVNDFSQGVLKVNVEGQNSFNKYYVDVSLRDYEFDNVKAAGTLDFSKQKPTMDLGVKFREYELNGFSDFGEGVIENLRGRLSGAFRATGAIANPDFNGKLQLDDAGLTFPYLNIDFDFVENTRIRLKDKFVVFDKMVLQDTKFDTQGELSGIISHQEFEKWALNLVLNSENILVLDTKEVDDIPYYGRGFLKGTASIFGSTSNLNINVTGSTQPETVFVIPLSDVTTIDNYKLIRFKSNNTKVDDIDYHLEKVKGLNLKINLDVTKDAIAQVVIDKVSGSDLKGSGNGNLQIEIDTRGKFNMFGDLAIDKGAYNFKYGGIISKPFTVQKGGTISWNGDPYEAELDLTAIYNTKANPAQLLDNINSNRKIDVDLYTKITGGLFDSKQEFDIVIPNANSTVASELEFKLNENDINSKMQHFTFLLAFGTFYNEETIGDSASSGITGTAAQVASNILSNVLNNEDSKFQLGVGYTQGDNTDIQNITNSDNQVDVSVSTQLSERVLVNGSLGVPVGAETQTSIVGEVKVEVLLNEEGTLRANFFTRPNEIEYSLNEEGSTQGLGLSYQVNFNTLKELKQKVLEGKKKKRKKEAILAKQKSLINFRKKDTTITKNEKDN